MAKLRVTTYASAVVLIIGGALLSRVLLGSGWYGLWAGAALHGVVTAAYVSPRRQRAADNANRGEGPTFRR